MQAFAEDISEIKQAMLSSRTVFTPKEAAKYLDIAVSTLYKLTSAGIIPFSKPNGKLIYFSRRSLDEWMLSHPTQSRAARDVQAATYVTTHKKGNR